MVETDGINPTGAETPFPEPPKIEPPTVEGSQVQTPDVIEPPKLTDAQLLPPDEIRQSEYLLRSTAGTPGQESRITLEGDQLNFFAGVQGLDQTDLKELADFSFTLVVDRTQPQPRLRVEDDNPPEDCAVVVRNPSESGKVVTLALSKVDINIRLKPDETDRLRFVVTVVPNKK